VIPIHHPLTFAASLYVVLGVALTWPLLLHLGSVGPNDPGDSLLNIFLLAWNARELPLTERWWNLPQFYPVAGAMAFSEHLLGLSLLTTPVIAVTGNPLIGYNVAFLLSFPLCALAAHALAYQLTKRHDVAVVAGVAFAFAPYRMSQLAHIQVLSSYWMPLALLGLHRFLESRRPRWLALFAGSWYVQALACGYYLFYLSVLVGLWVLFFAPGRLAWRDLFRVGVAWLVAIAAMVPFALGYLRYLDAYGFVRGREEIASFSADLASVLSASGNLLIWGWLNVFGRPESALFPGLTLVLIVGWAVVLSWRQVEGHEATGLRAPALVAALAVVFGVVGVTPLWLGPWRVELGGVRLLSVGTAGKPLAVALLLGCVAVALHPAGRAAWRRRSPLAFYAAAAVLMWLLCLGPTPTVLGQPLFDAPSAPYYAPYAWLMMVPGVDGVRVPARFWTLATLCLAVAGSLAAARTAAAWPRLGRVLPLTVAALVTLEGWPTAVGLWPAPAWRPSPTDAVARLEVPMGPAQDVVALYRATEHRRAVFNGYSGYFAPHYGVLMNLMAARDPDVLGRLATVGPIEVLVDHANDESGSWRSFVASHPGARPAARSADYTLYAIPANTTARQGPASPGPPLPVARIEVSVHPDDVAFMVDGDLETRWHTGPQAPDNEVVVDLGTPRRVDLVELQLGGFQADFPRRFTLDLSTDGAAWSTIWSGRTAADALWAAIEDPRTLPLRFDGGGAEGRYIRMRQTGEDPVYYWSIAELVVYGW
jgi:hypothetical protein